MQLSTIIAVKADVLSKQQDNDFAGYDPFDGLNSRLFNTLRLDRIEPLRLIWLQAFKVLPVNLRALTGVQRARNPKGIALFILGLLEDYKRTGENFYLSEAEQLAVWLIGKRSPTGEWLHACWGYHFDWQARAFFVQKGQPNVITTSYIANAFHELFIHTQKQEYLDISIDAGRFVSKYLYVEPDSNMRFYAYIPGSPTLVHNASLWGAATVARAATYTGDAKLKEESLGVAQNSINFQKENGSWGYGTLGHHQFIDGFHTGYNLESLLSISNSLCTTQFDSSIKLGLDYYRTHFFLPDGTPKYYHNKVYPIDTHSSAQAVLTFGKLLANHGQPTDMELIDNIVIWTIKNMYIPRKQAFRYQITRYYNNNVVYTRWTQAWAYYALSYYINLKTN